MELCSMICHVTMLVIFLLFCKLIWGWVSGKVHTLKVYGSINCIFTENYIGDIHIYFSNENAEQLNINTALLNAILYSFPL